MSKKKEVTFNEALSKYYQLKGKYENNINNSLQKIILNKNLTKIEKQEAYKSLKKKCVICGQFGGTLFGQSGNMLTAVCGNVASPCNLDIKLEKASYNLLNNNLSEARNSLNNLKNKIIENKLNYLFGFESKNDTVEKFNFNKENLVNQVKQYKNDSEKYVNVTQNLENLEDLKILNETLSLEISHFKNLISNYNSSESKAFVKEAVELYKNRIKELTKNIQELSYKYQDVNIDFISNEINLIQKVYLLKQLENQVPGTENKIISYTI